MTFHVEMHWRCATCKTENLGRRKECQLCLKPIKDEKFYDAPGTEHPTIANAVADPALIKQATAGADWRCRYCSSSQRRDSGECAQCGSDQKESAQAPKWLRDILADHEGEARSEVAAKGTYLRHAKTHDTAPAVAVAVPPDRSNPRRKRLSWKPFAVVAGALSLLFLGWFLFRTRIVDARVTSVAWAHIVHVERYRIVSDCGFVEDQPIDAFDVTFDGMWHHHFVTVQRGYETQHYSEACGQDCRPGPTNCTPNGNGFKTCSQGPSICTTRYCSRTRQVPHYVQESVEMPHYTWHVWRWRHHRNVVEEGYDNEPRWPSAERIALNVGCVGQEQERATQSSDYTVTFTDIDNDTHKYSPRSEEEFRGLTIGTKRKVAVRIIGRNELVP